MQRVAKETKMNDDIYDAARAAYDKLTEAHPGLVVEFGDFFQGFVSGAAWGRNREIDKQQERILQAIDKLKGHLIYDFEIEKFLSRICVRGHLGQEP